MKHDVFISYSSKDKVVADAICAKLESEKIRCWYAPRDIEPGMEWAGAIVDGINEAKIMVLIFTDFANASKQVLREVSHAADTGTVIIPFKLTENLPSGSFDYYLKDIHWLDAVNERQERAIDNLCNLCKNNLVMIGDEKAKENVKENQGEQKLQNDYHAEYEKKPISDTSSKVLKTAGKGAKAIIYIFAASMLLLTGLIMFAAGIGLVIDDHDIASSIVCIVPGVAMLIGSVVIIIKVININKKGN